MQPTPSQRQFETTIELAAPRAAVWRALTEADELERWFAPDASVEPGVGGSVRWHWPQLHEWPQTIEVWEEGRRLCTRYDSGVDDGQGGKRPLFMDFTLAGEGGRTTLRLVHSGFGPEAGFDGEFDGISRGWMVELRSLRTYLEYHLGQERQIISAMRPVEGDLDVAWRRLTGPEGLDCGPEIDALAEGAPFAIERFAGVALHCAPREFSGRVTSLDDAWLRLTVEQCGAQPTAWLWLATYGQAAATLSELQARFDELAERLFSGASAQA